MRVAFLVAVTLIAVAPTAEAQRQCRTGKPCGRTCIARDKVCRIEAPGTIAPDTSPDRPPAPARRSRAGAFPTPIGATVPCNIVRVVDGDSVSCAGGLRVRLLLIDAPETNQRPYGSIATRALRQIVPVGTRTILELDVQQRDRYGRLLA
jgi:endonuclease YncB( thermonuclease family)